MKLQFSETVPFVTHLCSMGCTQASFPLPLELSHSTALGYISSHSPFMLQALQDRHSLPLAIHDAHPSLASLLGPKQDRRKHSGSP